jgi:hypothetical protein
MGGAALALAALGAAGCESKRELGVDGPSEQNGIVVESLELGQTGDGKCGVSGKIRNRTGAGQRVVLVFEAFDGDGQSVASAMATVDFVAAGRPAGYEARFRNFSDDGFLNDCDKVARVELHDVVL